jgi:hypothetical protein
MASAHPTWWYYLSQGVPLPARREPVMKKSSPVASKAPARLKLRRETLGILQLEQLREVVGQVASADGNCTTSGCPGFTHGN